VFLIRELGSEQAITWDMFMDEFNKHFFPRVVQEARLRQESS
jgi:hypothetical protein